MLPRFGFRLLGALEEYLQGEDGTHVGGMGASHVMGPPTVDERGFCRVRQSESWARITPPPWGTLCRLM